MLDMPRHAMPRRLLFASLIFAFAATVNTQTFGLLLARVADGMDLSVAALGGLRTLENVASIVVAILVAPVVDRYPRKWPLLTGFAAATLGALIMASMANAVAAVLYFLLNGAAVMLTISTVLAMPGDFLSGKPLNRVMGLLIGAFAFTPIFFLPVVGALVDRTDWRAGFVLTSGFIGLAALLALAVAPGQRQPHSEETGLGLLDRYRGLFDNRDLLLMLGSALMRFAQFGGLFTFLSALLERRYDLSISTIGLLFSALGVMFFLGSVSSGFVLHWFKPSRPLVEGGALVAGLFAVAFVADPGVAGTIVAVVVISFMLGVQENASTVLILNLGASARGAAMSWNELSAASGAMTGIGLGAFGLRLAGTSGFGLMLVALSLAGAVSTWFVLGRSRSPRLEVQPAE